MKIAFLYFVVLAFAQVYMPFVVVAAEDLLLVLLELAFEFVRVAVVAVDILMEIGAVLGS